MSRLPQMLFLCLSVSGLCPLASYSQFVPRKFEARKTADRPTIDGILSDSAWESAQNIDQFFAYQSGGAPAAAETSAKILWDDEFLYLAFEMQDADIRPSSVTAGQTGRDASLFLGDVIELFIREDRSATRYFEFEWSPKNGDVLDARFDERKFGPPGIAWDTAIVSAVRVQGTIDDTTDVDTGWTVESAIPLSSFEPISTNSRWTFTLARYDYFNPGHSKEQLMTSAIGAPDLPLAGFASGFHSYEVYDDLQFVPEPQPWSCGLVIVLLMILIAYRRPRHV